MADDFVKDPDAILDWNFDWNDWLSAGESIITSTFIASAGITVGNGSNGAAAPSISAGTTTVWLIGGSPSQPYRITNRITTNQARTDDRSITIRVKDR